MNVALCAQCGERPAQRPLASSRGDTVGYWPCVECCGHALHVLISDSLDEFRAWLDSFGGKGKGEDDDQ